MYRWIAAALLLTVGILPAKAVVGDLNLDGQVDFNDFFILADNFGKKGPVDTLRVAVFDTVVVYDTVAVVDPAPSRYTPARQVQIVSAVNPLAGMRVDTVEHLSKEFRLGPALAREVHPLLQVSFFDRDTIVTKLYLKPSGHLIEERKIPYKVELIAQEEGHFEFWFEASPYSSVLDLPAPTRFLYDADMNRIGESSDSSIGLTSYIAGKWYSLWGRKIAFLDIQADGSWKAEYAQSDLSVRGAWDGPFDAVTRQPVDFDEELQK